MSAETFVHLPTEVGAVQWLGDYSAFPAEWRASGSLLLEDGVLTVITGKGPATARIGDYVLFSWWDEFWPVTEMKFLASYRRKADA